ncbi:MAG: crotonase/enoyl-CoA hydratase family protein [Polyangiales bacterium]
MTEHRITTEKRGHLLLIGLDRPAKRNAFDPQMFEELAAAYTVMENDADVRCGVLFAHGDHFTGGLDLVKMAPTFAAGRFPMKDGDVDPLGLYGPVRTKPMVGAVQGMCFTIGIELMLACDVRVAGRTAKFSQVEVKRGIFPFGGATIRFARETGWGNAMRWILTGEDFDAMEAHRIGLVQEIDDQPIERAIAIATTIADQAPLGVRTTMLEARRAAAPDEAAHAKHLFQALGPIMQSEDAREGMMSFVERRAAKFTGR